MRVALTFFLLLSIALSSSSVLAQGTSALNKDPGFSEFDANPDGPWVIFRISRPPPTVWKNAFEGLPGPSLWLYRDASPFDGGVYQVVKVTPGRSYSFRVDWAAVRFNGGAGPQDIGKLARQVGIDPTGKTDPLASTVRWSPEHRGIGKFEVPELNVSAHALADTITIFLRAKNEYTDARAEVFFDNAILTENAAMGTIQIAPTAAPTQTPRPPSPTTVRTRIAQAPTQTVPPSPTVTVRPSDTPTPTFTRTPRPTATPEPIDSGRVSMLGAVITLSMLGAGGVGLVLFGWIMFRLLGRM